MDGKQVLPLEEYLETLDLVLAARGHLVVVARRAPRDDDEILHRVEALAKTEADVVLVDGVRSADAIRKVRATIGHKPLLFNQIADGRSPGFSLSELDDRGLDVAICSTPCLFAAHTAMDRALTALREHDGRPRR